MTVDMGLEALRAIPRQFVNDNRKAIKSVWTIYMKKVSTNDFLVEYMEMGGFADFPVRDEGAGMNFAKMDVGGKTRLQPDQRQLGFVITDRDKRFNRINKVERASKMLTQAALRTTERIAATPWNLAFTSTQKGWDGVCLCNTAHVRANGQTVANTPSAQVDLSVASLEAGLISFRIMPGSDGTIIDIRPRYLLVYPSEGPNARRILKNQQYYTGATGTAAGIPSNTPNAAATGVTNEYIQSFDLIVVENPYFTDTDAWFLVAATDEQEVLLVENEKMRERAFQHPFTEDFIYSLQFSQTAGHATDQGVYGSSGA